MIKINVGCGKWFFGDDWIHVDDNGHTKSEKNNICLGGHFDADIVYASHVLSYLDKENALGILKCWWETLKRGGELMIAVPDFQKMSSLYQNDNFPIEDFIGPLYGEMNNKSIYHKMCYDERSLSKLLHKAGFTEVRRIYNGFFQEFKDQSWSYLSDRNYSQGTLISLNLIATK